MGTPDAVALGQSGGGCILQHGGCLGAPEGGSSAVDASSLHGPPDSLPSPGQQHTRLHFPSFSDRVHTFAPLTGENVHSSPFSSYVARSFNHSQPKEKRAGKTDRSRSCVCLCMNVCLHVCVSARVRMQGPLTGVCVFVQEQLVILCLDKR